MSNVARKISLAMSIGLLLLLTTACFITDLFDFDKDDDDGCPPDTPTSVCVPIEPAADGGLGGTGGDAGSNRPCPLLDGIYTISGCPATSCTIDQPDDDCFADITCMTSVGTLMSPSFIEQDGSFMVTVASTGSCNLVGNSSGMVTGMCTDFIGISSCNFVGTRN